jgi:sec-independent protein translocase protein TatC
MHGGLQLEALPGVEEYLNLVMQFILAFGTSFLLPVLLMLLNRAGLVTRRSLWPLVAMSSWVSPRSRR